MFTITIPKKITGSEELVVMPRRAYEDMKSRMLPVKFLSRKSAEKLDRRVNSGLKYYRSGKIRKINSLADLG